MADESGSGPLPSPEEENTALKAQVNQLSTEVGELHKKLEDAETKIAGLEKSEETEDAPPAPTPPPVESERLKVLKAHRDEISTLINELNSRLQEVHNELVSVEQEISAEEKA